MAKRGKYAGIVDQLERTWGTEPTYQQKVDERKRQILDVTHETDKRPAIFEALEETFHRWQHLNILVIEAALGKRWGSNLSNAYAVARRVKEKLEEQEYELNMTLAALEQLLIEQYEAEGVSSLTLDDGSSVRVQPEPHAKVVDRDAFREWCMKNGYERSLALPWQTTNSLLKEMLVKGQGQPDGVEAKSMSKVFFTRK